MENDTVGAYYMRIYNSKCYNFPLAIYTVEMLTIEHGKSEVLVAKEKELNNLK